MEDIQPEILRCAIPAVKAFWLGLVLYQSCRLWRSFIVIQGLRLVSIWSGYSSSLRPCSISRCTKGAIFLRWSWLGNTGASGVEGDLFRSYWKIGRCVVPCVFLVESKVDGAASTESSSKSAELVTNVSAVQNDTSPLPEKEKSSDSKGSTGLLGYPDLISGGQLEVQRLEYPSKEELKAKLESLHPEFVSFHGEQGSGKCDIGGLVLDGDKVDTPEDLVAVFGSSLPKLVYLEIPSGEKTGNALLKLGIKHVIYWKLASCTRSLAFHFRQGLIAALQSSAPGGWEAYQLAKSCSQLYFYRSKLEGHPVPRNCWPHVLGDAPPKIQVVSAEVPGDGERPKASEAAMAAIQIFDDEVEVRMLVCTEISKPDNAWLDAMEGGLSGLLAIEARALRMLNKISAPPPPMAAAVFARGIVTMRCDICTRSYARVALLVSGSAQLCFDDQQLESSIKKELVERVRLIRVVKPVEDKRAPVPICEMRRSLCIASGARVVEVRFRTPAWALQVLRQLAVNPNYRTFVALGIAGVQGSPVAAFKKEDAVLIASSNFERPEIDLTTPIPAWFKLPPPTKKRVNLFELNKRLNEIRRSEDPPKAYSDILNSSDPGAMADKELFAGRTLQQNLNLLEAMKPIPQMARQKPNPYAALVAAAHVGPSAKANPGGGPSGKTGRSNTANGTSTAASHSQTVTPGSLLLAGNAPLVKPHGCNRRPIEDCAEEDFLSDLIKFLVSRGHGRLIPPAGAEGFPEVVLNGKRLDLYNLYKEVVSRGGFHVGNGINWKGQVFSKMRNHTLTNKMTGVGNTLKKHYETYLLEYELAHNDVDGECCILCHSGAAGDWVNCGSCGEWAHFGCDKRTGLGTFKEYSKTDGLDYICPNCSTANGRLTKRNKVKHSGNDPTESVVSKGVPRKSGR